MSDKTQLDQFEYEQNTIKLNNIISSFQNIEQQTTKSIHDLFKPANVYFVPDGSNQCKLENCIHLRNLITCIKQQKTHGKITFSNTIILNSFEHLQSQHSTQFEDIYNIITTKYSSCDGLKCIHIRRNYRDRSKTVDNEQKSPKDSNIKENVTEQIFDSIHCYYFHSFDMGYRLRKQQFRQFDNKKLIDRTLIFRLINDLINKHKKKYVNILNRNDNKFLFKNQRHHKYCYGVRYFYWDYYKNNNATSDNAYHTSGTGSGGSIPAANGRSPLKEWYIEQKYLSMKDEMLNNHICSLTSTSWQRLLQKAHAHIDTDIVKKIGFCSRSSTAKCYDMKYGTLMKLDHLIAMMIYCNYTELQRKFTETYRRMDEKECDEVMRARHSN
eukprot:215144_1